VGKSLEKILESDWTLAAVKRREEERLKGERAPAPTDIEVAPARPARDLSGNNWIAEAFRRRQEEERRKAASQLSRGGGRADAADREVPVDNWLIEGFKRHQEEERRREAIPPLDESAAVPDHRSTLDLEPSASQDVVAAMQVSLSSDLAGRLLAPDAEDEAPVGGAAPLAAPLDGAAIDRRQGRAARWTTIAGLLAVGGVIAYIGLKTALWSPPESSRGFDRGDAPGAAPPAKLEDAAPGASQSVETSAPSKTEPEKKEESAPTDGPAAHPSEAEPPASSDALTGPAPASQAPEKSEPHPATPRAEEDSKAQAPSAEPSDKAVQENGAAPEALPPAPLPRPATGAAPPEKKPNAEPAAVAPERAREQIKPEHEQNASETKRRSNVDAKPKQQAKEKNAGRHAGRKADGLTTFLKRTANSVRKFFGRLGERQ
jgi:hypothetical protein